jgi:hypothetical protein
MRQRTCFLRTVLSTEKPGILPRNGAARMAARPDMGNERKKRIARVNPLHPASRAPNPTVNERRRVRKTPKRMT